MMFLTCAGVSLALISSLWCFLALRRYSRWGRRRGTQIDNPVRRELHKSQLAHLQCISMTLLDQYELPVCGQMRVVSWSWIRHGPGTPGNNFCFTIPVQVLDWRVGILQPWNLMGLLTLNRGGRGSRQGSPVHQLSSQSHPRAPGKGRKVEGEKSQLENLVVTRPASSLDALVTK